MSASRLLALSLLAAALPAQDPPAGQAPIAPQPAANQGTSEQQLTQARNESARMASVRVPLHTAAADLGTAYGLWAAGDDYKAGFANGVTFIPYLGRDYPHNQPLGWHTSSIKVGNTELAAEQPEAVRSDYRYELRHGAVTEAYDVLAQGLEQTFTLAQKPGASGDLVIRGAIATMLTAKTAGGAQQTLTFADEQGRDILTYGAATAIDANGNRAAMSSHYAGGALTLTLDGNWLATAAFPVVVDPLLAAVTVATWGGAAGTGQVESDDIGRDDEAVTANVMVVYSRAASATDGDLYARLVNDDFTNNVTVFTDITTSWDSDSIRCAYVGGAHKWAVVFRRYFPANTPRQSQIRCHVHASADTVLSTAYGSLLPPANNNDWRPDVGGVESFALGSDGLIVFQREDNTAGTGNFSNTTTSDVMASLLDATTANGTFGTPFLVLSGTTFDCERPSVNQVAEGGASFSWVTVAQVYDASGVNDDWDLWGKRIDNTGTLATGSLFTDLALTQTTHQMGPVVEGQRGRYLLAFTTTDTATTSFPTSLIAGKQLRCERFDWTNLNAAPTNIQPSVVLETNTDRRWEATGCAYDTITDSHWLVGHRSIPPGAGAAYITRVGYQGQQLEALFPYYVAGDLAGQVACVFDNDNNQMLLAYSVDNGTTHPVYAQAYTYPAVAAPTNFGIGCNPALLSWNSTYYQQIGSEFGGISSTGATAGDLHFLLVSMSTLNALLIHPAVPAGCRLLVDSIGPGYLGMLDLRIGANVAWRLSLPEFLGTATYHFQDWILDPATGMFSSTSRLSVPTIR